MLIEERGHEFRPNFHALNILNANAGVPDGEVQAALGVRFLNLSLGKQRGMIATRHAFREFRTDPEEWRRLHLAKEIVGDKYADADSEHSRSGSICSFFHFFKRDR
ncbi:MAG: hypothetical protein WAJ92_14075 [Candidatus Acidiferrales bacterium]